MFRNTVNSISYVAKSKIWKRVLRFTGCLRNRTYLISFQSRTLILTVIPELLNRCLRLLWVVLWWQTPLFLFKLCHDFMTVQVTPFNMQVGRSAQVGVPSSPPSPPVQWVLWLRPYLWGVTERLSCPQSPRWHLFQQQDPHEERGLSTELSLWQQNQESTHLLWPHLHSKCKLHLYM